MPRDCSLTGDTCAPVGSAQHSGLLTSDQDICETLADQYERVSSTASHYAGASFDTQHRMHIESEVRNFRQHLSFANNGPPELESDITPEDVAAQACSLHNNKAPSPLDNINNELLKYGGTALHTSLAAFFNLQFTLETKAKTCGVPYL